MKKKKTGKKGVLCDQYGRDYIKKYGDLTYECKCGFVGKVKTNADMIGFRVVKRIRRTTTETLYRETVCINCIHKRAVDKRLRGSAESKACKVCDHITNGKTKKCSKCGNTTFYYGKDD